MVQTQTVPRLIATSVIRGRQKLDSQGGVFLIDMEQEHVVLALDWNTAGLDWQGRGFELGLRGITCTPDTVYLAAGDELFAYSPQFKLLGSWRNEYLKQCRGIALHQGKLFLTSGAFDSILAFDLEQRKFDWAMHIHLKQYRFKGAPFDPNGADGPLALNKLELTDVFCNSAGMYISGLNTGGLLHFNGTTVLMTAELPPGALNARPFRKGVLYIDNEMSALRYCGRTDSKEDRALPLPAHNPADLQHTDADFSGEAQAGFGRGLCVVNERAVAVGTSPATVTLYDLQKNRRLFSVNLSRDVRTAIHSVAIWPYLGPF